jgi:hypothetical protein
MRPSRDRGNARCGICAQIKLKGDEWGSDEGDHKRERVQTRKTAKMRMLDGGSVARAWGGRRVARRPGEWD